MIELRGVSWDHPRGHDCVVAAAASYMAENPEVRIVWETRSLQAFADEPVERLAERYDLLIIDHPFVGRAAASGCLLPLDEHLDAVYLADQARHSVGPSHASYGYGGHQWGLASDAAGHVCAYRPDLLEPMGGLPRTWDDVLRLAERRRRQPTAQVALPLIPVDAYCAFCSVCAALGEGPFGSPARTVERAVGREALGMLRALRDVAHPESLHRNPPRLLDLMATTDEIAYVPILFGYSNYARPGFRPHLIRFGPVPTTGGGPPRGGILGGAGIAVSAATANPAAAAAYAAHVASPAVQRGVYFAAGGQPGHRAAWLDGGINAAASGFFRDTLETLDNAYLRPRYDGYLAVQEGGGEAIHRWLVEDDPAPAPLLDDLDALYRASGPPA